VWADLELDTDRAADGRDTVGGGILVMVVADATTMNVQALRETGALPCAPSARQRP
jgi:hypothetical protein